MSALARYFNAHGVQVMGYDKTSTLLTDQLQQEGIGVHFNDDITQIPENLDLVIYTPAIPTDLNEFIYLNESGLPIKKRSEVLGLLTQNKKTVAVAGTHGKTTVSSMIAHLLFNSSSGCSALLGGITKNYNSNLLVNSKSEIMVVEADEFDKSFLQLQPFASVITSVDADHLDIYGDVEELKNSFSEFGSQTAEDGFLVIKKGIDLNLAGITTQDIFRYSVSEKADYYGTNINYSNGEFSFDLFTPDILIENIRLNMHGFINVENAVAASAIALQLGVSPDDLRASLGEFTGVKRRFDYQVREDDLIFIDDYAHHPEEIKGLVNSVKAMYPGKRVLGIFQPHLFSRTLDFADEFASSLELLDETILLPIYPARELPIEGVNSEMLRNKISRNKTTIVEKDDLIDLLATKQFDILLTIGAGDIDKLVGPIKDYLVTIIQKQKP